MVDYLLMNSTPRAIPLIKLVLQHVNSEQMSASEVTSLLEGDSDVDLFGVALRILLDEYPLDDLSERVLHGKTILDHLLMCPPPRAIPLIKLVLQKVIVEQMDQIGMERWKMQVSKLVDSLDWNGNLEVRRQCLDTVLALFCLRFKTEATSLLELALWKKNVKALERMSLFVPRSTKRRKVDRHTCRVTSGASEVVVPRVIGFLWDKGATMVPVDLSMLPSHVSWMKERSI
mmetsp:Transcript_42290/g.102193  ORF Transcript_42290/g.102193 Transcript_42290/m.102193 type:complete len:231 (+) Transcript_42290:1578-2270(+)